MELEIRLQNNICKVQVYAFMCSNEEDLNLDQESCIFSST